VKRLLFILAACLLSFLSPYQGVYANSNETVIYSLNSLHIHVKQLVKELEQKPIECKIHFEENDIDELWQNAFNGHFQNDIERAKSLYDVAVKEQKLEDLQKLTRLLGHIWKKANGKFLDRLTAKQVNQDFSRYFIQQNHWLKDAMDEIFSPYNPLEKISFLKKAGFQVVSKRANPLYVVSHKKLPGYLVKLYLNSENVGKQLTSKWLINRCLGAENVRNLIRAKKIKHFSVPDKWIYLLPGYEELNDDNNAVLIVTNMNIVSEEQTKWAWKNKITYRHLDELFLILSHGFSSTYLVGNIPYSSVANKGRGSFCCLDTEYPERLLPLNKVSSYLSPKKRAYWEKLVKKAGKRGKRVTK